VSPGHLLLAHVYLGTLAALQEGEAAGRDINRRCVLREHDRTARHAEAIKSGATGGAAGRVAATRSPAIPKRAAVNNPQYPEDQMASEKQSQAARRNIKKAASAARRKRTIAHLPKSTRTALGKQASKMRRRGSRST
jgi:hypothetical protein